MTTTATTSTFHERAQRLLRIASRERNTVLQEFLTDIVYQYVHTSERDLAVERLEKIETQIADRERQRREREDEKVKAELREAEQLVALQERRRVIATEIARLTEIAGPNAMGDAIKLFKVGKLDEAETRVEATRVALRERTEVRRARAIEIRWIGVWEPRVEYLKGDVVQHQGSSYVTVEATFVEPPAAPWELLAAKGEKGDPGAGGSGPKGDKGDKGDPGEPGTAEDEMPLNVEIDDVGGGVTYVGEAQPGTLESAPGWRIKRITEVGADVSVEWASGTADFDKTWDDRLSYSYS